MKTGFSESIIAISIAGILAIFVFITLNALGVKEYVPPAYDPYVNDYVNIINKQDEQSLKSILENVHLNQGLHINVVTIMSVQSYAFDVNETIGVFAYNFYKKWKSSKINNDLDVLVLVSTGTREIRIEFGGSREGKYNADMEKIIKTSMTPAFRQGRYSYGIFNGIQGIVKTLTGAVIDANPNMAGDLDICNLWGQALGNSKDMLLFMANILLWFFVINGFISSLRQVGFWGGGGDGGGGGSGGSGGGGGGGSGDGGGGGW